MTIEIDGTDRTDQIEFGSINKTDCINSQTDSLSFRIIYHAGKTYRPAVNSEVTMLDGATKVFAGKINTIEIQSLENGSLAYDVTCNDYSYDLTRYVVIEEYASHTVEDIIKDVIDSFAPGFTYTNAVCDLVLSYKVFDRVTVFDVLRDLADITGYSWYVDYDKDIHFFEKNSEPAPFNVTDNDGKTLVESLSITHDLTQIRNRIYVRGGEVEGDPRTEYFNGDGTKLQFKLANKFAHVPTVTVGGAPKSVGVDYLDNEASFDCFWDYNQLYIRFKVAPVSGTNNIVVTGIPLYNLVVQVGDPVSIAQYGVFEYVKTDKTIRDRDTAIAMAKAELEGYKNGLIEGRFETYDSGLRSGQIINISSTLMNLNEDFLIQRVQYRMLSTTLGVWRAELATLRTVKIIDFLINLLKREGKIMTETGEVVLEKSEFPIEYGGATESVEVLTEENEQTEAGEGVDTCTVQAIDYQPEWVIGPQAPSGTKRVLICDGGYIN